VVGFDTIVNDNVGIGGGNIDFSAVDALGNLVNWPTAPLEVWGNIALRGGNTDTDGFDTRITNVDAPIGNRDAANKAYVDAAAGGGAAGGTTVTTIFGTSPTGLIDPNTGNPYLNPPIAGQGTPQCSILNKPAVTGFGTWEELYAGWGPHHGIYENLVYGKASINPPGNIIVTGSLAPGDDIDLEYASISGANCSFSRQQTVGIQSLAPGIAAGATGIPSSVTVDACTDNQCNTCRVCQFVWNPPVTP